MRTNKSERGGRFKKKQGNRNEKIQELKPIPQKVGQVIRQDKNKYIDFKQIKDSTKAKLIELKKYNIDTTQFLCFKCLEKGHRNKDCNKYKQPYPTEQTLCITRGRNGNMQPCGYHAKQDCLANKQVRNLNKQTHKIEIWQANRNNDRQSAGRGRRGHN